MIVVEFTMREIKVCWNRSFFRYFVFKMTFGDKMRTEELQEHVNIINDQ